MCSFYSWTCTVSRASHKMFNGEQDRLFIDEQTEERYRKVSDLINIRNKTQMNFRNPACISQLGLHSLKQSNIAWRVRL